MQNTKNLDPSALRSPEELEGMWSELSDIPVDEYEVTEEDFYWWPAGTDRYEIWHWFDMAHPL